MTFTESNTVEALVRDILCGIVTHHTAVGPGLARRRGTLSGLGWHYLGAQQLPRQAHEILVEDHVREALIRLNPVRSVFGRRADLRPQLPRPAAAGGGSPGRLERSETRGAG